MPAEGMDRVHKVQQNTRSESAGPREKNFRESKNQGPISAVRQLHRSRHPALTRKGIARTAQAHINRARQTARCDSYVAGTEANMALTK